MPGKAIPVSRRVEWDSKRIEMRKTRLPKSLRRDIRLTVRAVAENYLAAIPESDRPRYRFQVINPKTGRIIHKAMAERVRDLKQTFTRAAGHEDRLLFAPTLERTVWEHYPEHLRGLREEPNATNRTEYLLAVMGEYANAVRDVLKPLGSTPNSERLLTAVSRVVPTTHFHFDDTQVAQALPWTQRASGREDPSVTLLRTLETQGHAVILGPGRQGNQGLPAALAVLVRDWYGKPGRK